MLLITLGATLVVKDDCSTWLNAGIERIEEQEGVENLAWKREGKGKPRTSVQRQKINIKMELREIGVKIRTELNLLRTESNDGSVVTVTAIWLL